MIHTKSHDPLNEKAQKHLSGIYTDCANECPQSILKSTAYKVSDCFPSNAHLFYQCKLKSTAKNSKLTPLATKIIQNSKLNPPKRCGLSIFSIEIFL